MSTFAVQSSLTETISFSFSGEVSQSFTNVEWPFICLIRSPVSGQCTRTVLSAEEVTMYLHNLSVDFFVTIAVKLEDEENKKQKWRKLQRKTWKRGVKEMKMKRKMNENTFHLKSTLSLWLVLCVLVECLVRSCIGLW